MQLLRYATSVYGDNVIIGASFDLLVWFVAAGAAAILIHALFKAVMLPRKHDAH